MEISSASQILSPELVTFGISHLGIYFHRNYRILRRRELSKSYHYKSLLIEHIVSHATIPLVMAPIARIESIDPYSYVGIAMGVLCGTVKAIGQDWRGSPDGKPQWDQLVADAIGTGIYVVGMLALFHSK